MSRATDMTKAAQDLGSYTVKIPVYLGCPDVLACLKLL